MDKDINIIIDMLINEKINPYIQENDEIAITDRSFGIRDFKNKNHNN